jgi:type IV pilus assembly protein PilW
MGSIGYVYYSQQQSYLAQEQIAAAQQNLRAAMYYMEREIRMAGCDPTRNAGAGIAAANAGSISFTEDIRGDAEGSEPDGDTDDPNESIGYSLSGADLVRTAGGVNNVIAANIDALDFVYLDKDDTVTATTEDIRSIQITLVAKTSREDRGYTDTTDYENQQGDIILAAPNDGFRRRVLRTTIRCRNLGL